MTEVVADTQRLRHPVVLFLAETDCHTSRLANSFRLDSRYFFVPELCATAARIRAFNADSSILSFSVKSIARVAFASRPALNNRFGSFKEAPLKKLSFTWSLKAPAAQTMPLLVHTAVPHFHSSVTFGAVSRINLRNRASSLPRQSPSSSIILVMSCEAFTSPPLLLFMNSPSLVTSSI